jgi:hypothetical protein
MTVPALRPAVDADALRSAAQRLHEQTLDPACAASVPITLAAIEGALAELSCTASAAAHALVPPANGDAGITDRYARAAAVWPSPRDGAGPSYEQQARALASLHDAAAALRVAARHCGRAAEHVAATMQPVDTVHERMSEAA